MPRFASFADVLVDVGEGVIPASDEARVLKLIDRAEARITQVVGDPADLVASGRTDDVLVCQVVSEMVASVLRNPQAWQSSTTARTTGPFTDSTTHQVNLAVASGQLRLSDEHVTLLGGRDHGPVQGPFSLELSPW